MTAWDTATFQPRALPFPPPFCFSQRGWHLLTFQFHAVLIKLIFGKSLAPTPVAQGLLSWPAIFFFYNNGGQKRGFMQKQDW